MIKKKTFISFALGFFLLIAAFAHGQIPSETKTWKDGDPTFVNTRPSDRFVSFTDETRTALELTPVKESLADDTLDLALDGIDWTWPSDINISSAKEIDYIRISDQDIYTVVDALGRRVMQYNASDEVVSWEFGSVSVSDPKYLDRPVAVQTFVEGGFYKVLITDKGLHRILKVDQITKRVEWQYGTGLEGFGDNELSSPQDAIKIPGQPRYVVADEGNDRVLIVNEQPNVIVWTWYADSLNSPYDVEYSEADSAVLVTDRGNHRVVLISPATNRVLWQFGVKGSALSGTQGLNSPSDADILDNGNILICDTGNKRLIEVNRAGEIVWSFHGELSGLLDADRLSDNRHVAVYRDQITKLDAPVRLGYSDHSFESSIYDFEREVLFENLYWTTQELPGATSVKFQLRSANTLPDLQIAQWYGPAGTGDFYASEGQAINSVHTGHRFFQFRAFLQTNSALYTPVLNGIRVDYRYYPTGVKPSSFLSDPILEGEPENTLVTKWKTLEFNTEIPDAPALKDKINMEVQIRLWDGKNFPLIASFPASKTSESNKINLEANSELQGVQNIYLFARISTTNSSVTPVLNDWSITYEVVTAVRSDLYFANYKGQKAGFLRAPETLPAIEARVDSVDIRLIDYDLPAFRDSIDVTVTALRSGDSEVVTLRTLGNGEFAPLPKLPLLISNGASTNNFLMEVFDRDTLTVSYQDPINAMDSAVARVLVIKNTAGELKIVDNKGQTLTQVDFGAVLYFSLENENDKNLDPDKQDTVYVKVFDRTTSDEERVLLKEIVGTDGLYNTGNFASEVGIPVVSSNNGIVDDGRLQALAGHTITAEYIDNTTHRAEVKVKDGAAGVTIYLGGEVYIAEVAPNPYYESEGLPLKIRVASSTGDLKVRLLEVFTLAGEKVTEIPGESLSFNVGPTVEKDQYGVAENWWNLTNNSGQPVASGTYFVKVHAELHDNDSGSFQNVTYLRKFVIVR